MKITTTLTAWLSLHRRVGMAEGLLSGWLMHDDHSAAKTATERFLAEPLPEFEISIADEPRCSITGQPLTLEERYHDECG